MVVGLVLVQKRGVRRFMNAAVFGIGYLVLFLLLVVFRVQSIFGLFIEKDVYKRQVEKSQQSDGIRS